MNKAEKNILRGELIGAKVKIDDRWEGKIIDETKNMFLVATDDGEKKFIKKTHDFEITKNRETIKINGEKLCIKPEERIKEKWLKKI